MSLDENKKSYGLEALRPAPGSHRQAKRLGRGTGSGKGRTCGKGHKGQKARSGYRYRPRFEGGQMPIQRRLPKRGFSNYPFRKIWQVVNLKRLAALCTAGQEVNPEVLFALGLINKVDQPVKILGDGDLTIALQVHTHAASQQAIEKIKAAGGEVHLIC